MATILNFSELFENGTDKTHNTPLVSSSTTQASTDKTPTRLGFVTDKTPSAALLARAEKILEPPMPPDIQAAYDRGESVTFSKLRGRWEVYKVLQPPVDLSDEARNLLLLYELGLLSPRVHEQLTELFTENPKDIDERLEKAGHFVNQQAETRQKMSTKKEPGLFDPKQCPKLPAFKVLQEVDHLCIELHGNPEAYWGCESLSRLHERDLDELWSLYHHLELHGDELRRDNPTVYAAEHAELERAGAEMVARLEQIKARLGQRPGYEGIPNDE